MSEHRIITFTNPTVNPASRELHFELRIGGEDKPLAFVATFEVAAQLTDALGRTVSDSRPMIPPAERIVSHHVGKDQSHNLVTMRFGTPSGIPHTFALEAERAAEIGEELKATSIRMRPLPT
jgi:hypothetical protein